MCKDCEDHKTLNLHCSNCGSNNIISSVDKQFVKNNLGLTCPVSVYQCKDCNERFLICPECEGTGFISKHLVGIDYNDCDVCSGMGLINIKNFI